MRITEAGNITFTAGTGQQFQVAGTATISGNLGIGGTITTASVNSASIADGTVTGTDLAAGTITNANMAADSVTSTNIVNGTITTADLAVNAVTTDIIVDGTITFADLAFGTARDNLGITQNQVDAIDVATTASAANPFATIADLSAVGAITACGVQAPGQVTFWSGTTTICGDNDLFWDNTAKQLHLDNSLSGTVSLVLGTLTPYENMLSVANNNLTIQGRMGGNDFFRIFGRDPSGTGNGGELVITSGDNGTEPMIFAQWNVAQGIAGLMERMRIAGNGDVHVTNTGGATFLIQDTTDDANLMTRSERSISGVTISMWDVLAKDNAGNFTNYGRIRCNIKSSTDGLEKGEMRLGVATSGPLSDKVVIDDVGMTVNGNFSATGSKSADVETVTYGRRRLYAQEGTEVRFSEYGKARLVNGVARVDLNPVFLETIEQDPGSYSIQVTAAGASQGIYADETEVKADHFIVRENNNGTNSISFYWTLTAVRKGYAGVRLEKIDNPGAGGISVGGTTTVSGQ